MPEKKESLGKIIHDQLPSVIMATGAVLVFMFLGVVVLLSIVLDESKEQWHFGHDPVGKAEGLIET